ncbi:MAG: Ig-like domain-containing protein [Deltaproteobacteria bacterium]|nr:Ig-like domain-containing protein [Deltaproteobacteria bacterium]
MEQTNSHLRGRRPILYWIMAMALGVLLGCTSGGDVASPEPSPAAPEPQGSELKAQGFAPADGATGVSPDQRLAVQFNQPVDSGTINTTNIKLIRADGTSVDGTITLDSEHNIAIFTPSIKLSLQTTYHLIVTPGVRSATGVQLSHEQEISFTCGEAQAAAPAVLETNPPDGAINISMQEKIKIKFKEAIDASTVNNTTIRLKKSDGSEIAAKIEFDLATNTALVTPEGTLEANMVYHLEVTTGVRSLANLTLSSSFTLQFSTGEEIAAPLVISTTPADGATDVAVTEKVSIQFSQAMDASTLTATNIRLLTSDGAVVSMSLTYETTSNMVLITPTATLEANTTYTLEISTNVKSSSGVAMSNTATAKFTTGA